MSAPQTPGFLPGQSPVGYGMTPGVHHDTGIPAPPAPYGMLPGQRHVLPDQINLDAPPAPEAVSLDGAPPRATGMPGVLPQTHSVRSFRVTNDKGETVAELPDNPNAGAGNDYYKSEVQKIGDSLISQAVNPADKEAAARATQFGLSLVGLMPIKDIQTAIVHRYDTDERNSISREVQDAKSKRAALMGKGGPALGPSKADMANHKLSADMWGLVNGVVDKDRQATKYAAISEQENSVAEGLKLLSQPNAMAQRVEVQRALLELTGKASRESEQTALTGAAGKWNELANKLSLWTSDDPQLSRQYIQQFKSMLAAQAAYIAEQKDKLGRETAATVYSETSSYPEDERQAASDAAYGRMTGRQAKAYVPPHERGAAQPASPAPTGGPAVSPHLSKYLK